MKLEFSRQIFEKKSNIKFHENPSSGSPVVLCRPMGMTKLTVAFRNLKRPSQYSRRTNSLASPFWTRRKKGKKERVRFSNYVPGEAVLSTYHIIFTSRWLAGCGLRISIMHYPRTGGPQIRRLLLLLLLLLLLRTTTKASRIFNCKTWHFPCTDTFTQITLLQTHSHER
jgi:hypothetical protein